MIEVHILNHQHKIFINNENSRNKLKYIVYKSKARVFLGASDSPVLLI